MQAVAVLPLSPRLQQPLALDLRRSTMAATAATRWWWWRRPPPCSRRSSSPLHIALCLQRHPARRVDGGGQSDKFDDLFNEMKYEGGNQKPSTKEADNDAECLSFAVRLAKVADDVKGADIRLLSVKRLVFWTQYFIIVTAFSTPQVDAIGSRMRHTAEKEFNIIDAEDDKPSSWTLLDFGDVVVHIFLPEERALYNLEEFYGNGTLIELPFDNHSRIRN